MISDEISVFIDSVKEYKSITNQTEIDILIKSIFKYYKIRKVNEIVNKNSSDIDELVRLIKEVPASLASCVEIVQLGSLIPSQVIEQELGDMNDLIPTQLDIVRNSTPFKAYLPGQVVQFCGAPGRGKSATMLYEVTGMAVANKKTLWLAMGDLLKFDFITRFTSVLTSEEYYKVALNPDKYWTIEVQEVANNIDLITIPAGKLTSDELVNLVNNSPIDYDVIVIDYDSNFKTDEENMYKSGGDVYNDLTAIARPPNKKARLVFIASQPKTQFWNEMKIPLEGAGESSRKQHIVDIMITLGTVGADRPAGVIHIAKQRRGKAGADSGYMLTESGQVKEITMADLSLIRNYTS